MEKKDLESVLNCLNRKNMKLVKRKSHADHLLISFISVPSDLLVMVLFVCKNKKYGGYSFCKAVVVLHGSSRLHVDASE